VRPALVLVVGVGVLGAGAVDASSRTARRSAATTVEVVQTNSTLSQRLTRLPDVHFSTSRPAGVPVIHVEDSVRYQRIAGFGAAMTDTSAWLLYGQLSPASRATVMSNLFGAGVGAIHLGFVRVPIGASDFTKDGRPYSYDDLPPGQTDPSLSHFSVAHDDAYIVPALRQMLATNPDVKILANPWSPPGWMKTNHALGNPGNRGKLLRSAYGPLARYFVKFLQAYASRGVPIDSITPQNEPTQQASYPGLNWPESGEAQWIVQDLQPALRAAGLHPKVYGFDWHYAAHTYAQTLVRDRDVARGLAGVAWHCYVGDPNEMTRLHDLAPQLDQLETECSSGISPGPPAELVIASIRNWSTAVLLWNLALDPSGGPVQTPNYGCRHCTGVVTVDSRTGTVRYRPDYFQLGQASAFVQPGARRIRSEHFVKYNRTVWGAGVPYSTPGIDDVAFENPDGSKVLLAYNSASRPKRFAVDWHGGSFAYRLPAGATVTFVWDRPAAYP
jgi:glucosylceramidase